MTVYHWITLIFIEIRREKIFRLWIPANKCLAVYFSSLVWVFSKSSAIVFSATQINNIVHVENYRVLLYWWHACMADAFGNLRQIVVPSTATARRRLWRHFLLSALEVSRKNPLTWLPYNWFSYGKLSVKTRVASVFGFVFCRPDTEISTSATSCESDPIFARLDSVPSPSESSDLKGLFVLCVYLR